MTDVFLLQLREERPDLGYCRRCAFMLSLMSARKGKPDPSVNEDLINL